MSQWYTAVYSPIQTIALQELGWTVFRENFLPDRYSTMLSIHAEGGPPLAPFMMRKPIAPTPATHDGGEA